MVGVAFMLEFVTLCSRLDFMLNEGLAYVPHKLVDGSIEYYADGQMEDITLKNAELSGCSFNTTDAYRLPRGADCQYWLIDMGLELFSQGWVQFSVVISLILTFLMRGGAVGMKLWFEYHQELKIRDGEENNDDGLCVRMMGKWFAELGLFCVAFMLQTQQYLIIFPLEVIFPNAYCLDVEVPVPVEKAICLFKIAAAAVPIGLPLCVGCALVMRFIMHIFQNDTEKHWLVSLLLGIIFIQSVVWFGYGISMIVLWLFGGFVIGIWYSAAGLSLGFPSAEYAFTSFALTVAPFLLLKIELVVYNMYMLIGASSNNKVVPVEEDENKEVAGAVQAQRVEDTLKDIDDAQQAQHEKRLKDQRQLQQQQQL